jgi:hypothetical protein
MHRRTVFATLGLMCALGVLLLLVEPAPAQTPTLTVDGADPTCDDSTGTPAYCTIQAAVDAASTGSVINVAPATYAERVTIRTEGLRLRGDPGDTANRAADTFFGPGPDAPILDGSGLPSNPTGGNNSAIRVAAPATSVIVEGFEIRGYSGFRASGVEAWETTTNVSNVVINDNYIHDMEWNCVLVGSAGTTTHSNMQISRNRCEAYGAYGLELTNSDLSELRDNEVQLGGFAGILAGAQNTSGDLTVSALSIAGNVLTAGGATPPEAIAVYAWGRNGGTAQTTQARVTENTITTSGTAIVGYTLENGAISALRADTNTITINNPNTAAARLTAARCASLPAGLHVPTCAAQASLAADAASAIDAQSVAESLTIDANRIELTGTPGDGAYHAISVSGAATAAVSIAQNTLLGNSIGSDTNGILLTADLPASASIAINQNIFRGFARSIVSNTPASPSATGNLLSDVDTLALAHTTDSAFDAQGNWWGCNAGPGSAGCTTFFGTTVDASDPLQLSLTSASPLDSVETNGQLALRARVVNNQGDVLVDGIQISFAISAGGALGSIDPTADAIGNGTATTTLSTGAQPGPMTIAATLDNETVTLTIEVTSEPGPEPLAIFLPLIVNAAPAPPPALSYIDVVVSDIRLIPDKTTFTTGEAVEIVVTITNQGQRPTSLFWTDLYINPATPPRVNQVWDQNCGLFPCQGLTWRIEEPIEPGESLILTSNTADPLIDTNASIWYGFFFNGTTDLAVFADSWDPGVPTGALTEGADSNAPGEQNNTMWLSGLSVTGDNPPADVQPPVSPR